MTDTADRNRRAWDRWSDTYQAKHGQLLAGEHAAAWGLWRIPETKLGLLGDVRGRDVLELGCGAAHWSLALARRGARVVGIDASRRQLAHAYRAVTASGVPVDLVLGIAEDLPFADASFDIVFSDYGAMSWSDPDETLPEVARVLRPGGVLAFCTHSPFFFLFLDVEARTLRTSLQRDYFGLRTRHVEDAIDFQLPYGEWISLFRTSDLIVEELIEVKPPEESQTTFGDRPLDWARRWPVENIWRLRKE